MNIFQGLMFLLFSWVAYRLFRKSASLFDFGFVSVVYAVFILVLFYPNVLARLSKMLGITRGVDLFMYVSIFLLFAIIIKLLLMADKNRQDISKLNRKMAILMQKLEEDNHNGIKSV